MRQIDFTKTYTAEEYIWLPDDGNKYELVNGKLVEKSGIDAAHGMTIADVATALFDFVKSNRLGMLMCGQRYKYSENTVRCPDVSFVKTERLDDVELDYFFEGGCDLAIEVMAASEVWLDLIRKIEQHQAAKVPLVWVVDPWTRTVCIYRLAKGLVFEAVGPDEFLDGEDVLPSFKVKVSSFFRQMDD